MRNYPGGQLSVIRKGEFDDTPKRYSVEREQQGTENILLRESGEGISPNGDNEWIEQARREPAENRVVETKCVDRGSSVEENDQLCQTWL